VTPPETAAGGGELTKADVERDLKEALAKADDSVQKGILEKRSSSFSSKGSGWRKGLGGVGRPSVEKG